MASAATGSAATPAPPGRLPSPPGAATPPAPPSTFFGRVLRWLGRRFPKHPSEPATPSGNAAETRFHWPYLAASVALGLAFAALWLWVVRQAPIQPGDDPSTWLATSYFFIGVPGPGGVQPLAYPPAAFPFVGLSVWAGGGPILGGRIFMAAMITLLGPIGYLFARSVVRMPPLALLASGLLLAEPDFQQLYYFGGFPNMFAFLFLLLSLTFLVRWLRADRPLYLFLFWVFLMVTILSHSLTAVILAGTIAVFVLSLVPFSRLPRTFLVSRAGLAGLGVLVVGVGAYYGGTAALGIAHASYLSSSTLGPSKAQLIPTVVRPFYLNVLVSAVEHQNTTVTANQALGFMAGIALAILVLYLLIGWRRPQWLTASWLILAASILTVFAGAVAGYLANIPVDFRRFPYFLYFPVILTIVLAADSLIDAWLHPAPRPARLTAPTGRAAQRRARRPIRWRPWVEPLLLVVSVFVILGAAEFYTVPAGQNFESFFTEYGHDQNFLNAVDAMQATGIPGNILATTPLTGHWTSALTSRTTYTPSAIGGNSYATAQVIQGETTDVVLGNRFSVTNGLVVGSIPGVQSGEFNATPVFGAFNENLYQPFLEFPTTSFEVGATNGLATLMSPAGSASPPVVPIDGGTGYSLTFHGVGADLTQTVVAVPKTDELNVTFTATQNGTVPLSFVLVRAISLPGLVGSIVNSTMVGSFQWYTNTSFGNFTAVATAEPTSALTKVIPTNLTTGAVASAVFRQNAANSSTGANALTFSVLVADPTAINQVVGLPAWINADQVYQNWSIRFLLLFNGSATSRPFTQWYYQTEYGASLVTAQGPYRIMLLPSPPASPPWPLPVV